MPLTPVAYCTHHQMATLLHILNWVFKLKKDAKGEVVKHKAWLVEKGYVHP